MEDIAGDLPCWTANEAKTRFGAMLDQAIFQGPQRISRAGAETAVLVRVQDWRPAGPPTVGLCALLEAASQELVLTEMEIETLFVLDPTPVRSAPLDALQPGAEDGR